MNLADLLVLVLVLLLFYLVLFSASKFLQKHNRLSLFVHNLKQQFSYDSMSLFLQISFIAVFLSSLLNIYSKPEKGFSNGVAVVISVCLLFTCLFYMGFFAVFIFKNFKKLEKPEFKNRYRSFYDGLNTVTVWSACANLAWLLRGLTLLIIVFAL